MSEHVGVPYYFALLCGAKRDHGAHPCASHGVVVNVTGQDCLCIRGAGPGASWSAGTTGPVSLELAES